MISTHRLLPCPFDAAKSFFNVGIGTEILELKPEWRGVISPSAVRAEPRKAA